MEAEAIRGQSPARGASGCSGLVSVSSSSALVFMLLSGWCLGV